MIRGEIDRRGQEAAFIADLPDVHAWDVSKIQQQETRVASIQEAESITSLFNCLEGPGIPVHHDRIPKEFRVPDRCYITLRDVGSGDPIKEFARIRIKK